jgi:hypothetical protein
MAGRFAYFLIAGGAVVGGAFLQGDISFDRHDGDIEIAQALISGDPGEIDRRVDRIVDRETHNMTVASDGDEQSLDPAAKRALSAAVAELVRAEGSLIAAKLDDELPPAVIKQAEERRNAARQAVERLSADAKAESRGHRDALRENLRDDIRASVRDAVRN